MRISHCMQTVCISAVYMGWKCVPQLKLKEAIGREAISCSSNKRRYSCQLKPDFQRYVHLASEAEKKGYKLRCVGVKVPARGADTPWPCPMKLFRLFLFKGAGQNQTSFFGQNRYSLSGTLSGEETLLYYSVVFVTRK